MHRYLAGCMVLGFMHPMCASEKYLISDTEDDMGKRTISGVGQMYHNII